MGFKNQGDSLYSWLGSTNGLGISRRAVGASYLTLTITIVSRWPALTRAKRGRLDPHDRREVLAFNPTDAFVHMDIAFASGLTI